tara:strand:+ start:60 stop:371 length:312 start_codon:yes stop_codon:yes gene_type:complete
MWGQAITLQRITSDFSRSEEKRPDGRWIGMIRIKNEGRKWLTQAIEALRTSDDFHQLGIPDLINFMVDCGHTIRVWYIHGHWLDVNSLADLERAGNFTSEQDS